MISRRGLLKTIAAMGIPVALPGILKRDHPAKAPQNPCTAGADVIRQGYWTALRGRWEIHHGDAVMMDFDGRVVPAVHGRHGIFGVALENSTGPESRVLIQLTKRKAQS